MRSLLVLSFVSALVGCKSKEADAPAPKPAEPPMVPETTPLRPGSTASGIDLSKLAGQLKKESETRPKGIISVEQVWEALDKVDIKVERKKQILGLPVAASYCADARTSDKIVVIVCEYRSAREAEEGKRMTEDKYRAMNPNAIRRVNGGTVLTIVAGGNPAQTAHIDKIVETFSALSAREQSSGT
jgi:hypothetical protein